MKILLVTHYYPSHKGGIEIYAGRLAQYLTDAFSDTEIQWAASDIDARPDGIARTAYLPMRTMNFSERIFGIAYPLWSIRSLKRLYGAVKDADIVNLHHHAYMGNIAAFVFSRINKKPIVVTEHVGKVPYKNIFINALSALASSILGKYILEGADSVIFCSGIVRERFSGFCKFKSKPAIIPIGVDPSVFSPVDPIRRKEIRAYLGIPEDKKVVLFAGRFVEVKGIDKIKKMIPFFQNVIWVFSGWGKADPDKWGFPNVKVYKKSGIPLLVSLYRAADLLLVPDAGEGFPLVIQESMACGTPVMAAPGSVNAYAQARDLLFCESIDAKNATDKWVRKLEKILQDTSRLEELRPQVASFAKQHWDRKACAAKYYEIFKNLRNHPFVPRQS